MCIIPAVDTGAGVVVVMAGVGFTTGAAGAAVTASQQTV